METDRLAELIELKRRVLVQLRELALRQQAMLHSGETEKLLRLLSAKQPLVDQLTAIERHLDPFRQQDPEARSWRSPEHRQRCADSAGQCRQLLDEVLQAERQCLDAANTRQSQLAATLQAAGTASQAAAAYLSHELPDRGRIDLASET